MRRSFVVLTALLTCVVLANLELAQQQPKPAAPKPAVAARSPQAKPAVSPPSDLMPLEAQQALLQQNCRGCHNDTLKSGSMTLTSLDLAHVDKNPELAEKIIKKLRTGLMPPATASRRPDRAAALSFVKTLETQLDKTAALSPNPGTKLFQRLTRDEYGRSIGALFGIEVDVEKYLPKNKVREGMDNI